MKKFITMLVCLYFFFGHTMAQHDIRYGQAIFRPELINPAYRWVEQTIDLDAVYRFPWKRSQSPQGGMFNFHLAIPESSWGIGFRGDFYSGSSLRDNNQIGMTLDYRLKVGEKTALKIAAGAGTNKEKYDIGDIGVTLDEDFDKTHVYTELGTAFRYADLRIGFSAYSYSGYRMFFANARYNAGLGRKWGLDPLVSYSAYKGFDGILDLGAVIGYDQLVAVGLGYSTNDLVNLLA
ncbi:MAG: type IX secretion system membrane protein PorP/SprF, partial [Paludibacter sp.]